MLPSEVRARFEVLRTERSNIEGVWDVVERFVMPFRGRMFQETLNESSIDWSTREVYDSTAIMAAQNLASALQGSLTPAAIKWFEMAFEDANLNKDQEAMRWLEDAGNICFQALQDSNFNLESNETYLDIVGFGSSIIVEEAESEVDWDGLMFQSIPVKECFFEEDAKGNVLRLYRKLSWTIAQIVDKFGKENVPQTIVDKVNTPASATEKLDIIFCIFKREGKSDNYPSIPTERPVGKMYVMLKTGEMIGEEGGYYEMPAFIPKWRRTNGSKWGHSPAMLCISDILTLNQLVELILTAAEKVVDPTTLTTERGLLSDLDLGAGKIAVVRNTDDVKAYESKARFDVSELQREKLQDQINRSFYVDQLQLKQSPAMTAQEVMARMELMQRLLGPTLARMQNDFLDPLIQRTFNILYRAGQIPPMPESVKSAMMERKGMVKRMTDKVVSILTGYEKKKGNINDLKITYVSPLYIAQRASHINQINQWLVILGSMAQIPGGEAVMDIPNLEEIARGAGKMLGVPLDMVNSKAEAKAKGDARKNQIAQQNALAAIDTLGGAVKNVAAARAVPQ